MPLRGLFVDDEGEIELTRWYARFVRPYGWEYDVATTTEQARKLLAVKHYDFVLLDRQLTPLPEGGRMSGDSLLLYIVECYPHICPIMLTVNKDLESVKRLTKRGAFEYFGKKTSIEDIIAAVKRGVRRKWVRTIKPRLMAASSNEEVLNVLHEILRNDGEGMGFLLVEELSEGGFLVRGGCGTVRFMTELGDTADLAASLFPEASQLIDHFPITRVLRHEENLRVLGSAEFASAIIFPLHMHMDTKTRKGNARTLIVFSVGGDLSLSFDDQDSFFLLSGFVADAFSRVESSLEIRTTSSADGASYVLESLDILIESVNLAQAKVLTCQKLLSSCSDCAPVASELPKLLESVADGLRHSMRCIDYLQPAEPIYDGANRCDAVNSIRVAVQNFKEIHIVQGSAESHRIKFTESFPPVRSAVTVPFSSDFLADALHCLLRNATDSIICKLPAALDFEGSIDIKVSVNPCLSHVLVSVVDNGLGVCDDVVPRLFERGFSTKPKDPDGFRGLGLHTLKLIIDRSGGYVFGGNAAKGGGAEFTLVIPVVRDTSVTGVPYGA